MFFFLNSLQCMRCRENLCFNFPARVREFSKPILKSAQLFRNTHYLSELKSTRPVSYIYPHVQLQKPTRTRIPNKIKSSYIPQTPMQARARTHITNPRPTDALIKGTLRTSLSFLFTLYRARNSKSSSLSLSARI